MPQNLSQVPRKPLHFNHQPSTYQTPPPQQPEGSASQNQNSRLTEQEQIKLSETYATFIAGKKIGSGKHFPNKPPATWPISDDVSTHDLILAMRKFKFWGENHDTPHLASVASRIAKGARKQFTGHNTSQSWSGPANPVLVQPYGGQGWMFHGQATEAERLRQQIAFMLAGYSPGEHGFSGSDLLGLNAPACNVYGGPMDPELPDETWWERCTRKLDEIEGEGTAATIQAADLTLYFSPKTLVRMHSLKEIRPVMTPRKLSHRPIPAAV